MPRDVHAFEIVHHGNRRWRVLVPKALRNGGPAKRIFATKAKAEAFARELNAGRAGWSGQLLALAAEDQGRLVRVLERLDWSLANLEAAADRWLAGRVAMQKPLRDAALECVEAKRKAGRSWQYVENLGVALKSFWQGREAEPVSDITGEQIETWLNKQGWSASTRLTYLRRLETLLSFAIRRGWAVHDPTKGVERPTEPRRAISVLAVPDVAHLLATCRRVDPGLVPYFALAVFAGIRPDEVKRLRRENIKDGWIEVEAAKAKTRRRRLVEIHPTLKAWLDVPGGELGWRNWRRRWRSVIAETVVGARGPELPIAWSGDVLRHSFCSYAFPIHGAAWTAMHAGHSEQTLFLHYRELVHKSDAERFWQLTPEVVAHIPA